MKTVALSVGMSLLSSMVFAEPTYNETVNFIQSKTGMSYGVKPNYDYSADNNIVHYTQYFTEASKCNFLIDRTQKNRNGRLAVFRFTVDFSDLDPSRVTNVSHRPAQVYFDTTEGKKSILYYYHFGTSQFKEHRSYESRSSLITFSPADVNRPKLEKAIRHLISLCGGRKELF